MRTTKRIALGCLLLCGVAQAQETPKIDWDVLQHLPAKAIKSRIAELSAKDLSTEGIALESGMRPSMPIIYENKAWSGATTHYAGIDIPNLFDPTQKIGKWTFGEYAVWGGGAILTAVAGVVVENNRGSGGSVQAPVQSASVSASSGNRSASVDSCAGDAVVEISDHESGSGGIKAGCKQPTKQP